MKKKSLLIIFLILLLIPSIITYAHPGRTDSDGGHTNSSTGSYHYHHGYSAHQHTNGKCPYAFDDKTGSSSGTSSSNSTKETGASSINEDPIGYAITLIIGVSVLVIYIVPMGMTIIEELIYKIKEKFKE